MLSREQKRIGFLDHAAGPTDVDVRPDVFLFGQNGDAATGDRVFQGQLLQRVRHVIVALGHQSDRRVVGACPLTAVHRHTQHDRPPVTPTPVPASQTLAGHVRRGAVLVGHRLQTRHHRQEHPSEISRTVLSVLHRIHGTPGAHQPHQHPERCHANVV